jgi:hypothetical protein
VAWLCTSVADFFGWRQSLCRCSLLLSCKGLALSRFKPGLVSSAPKRAARIVRSQTLLFQHSLENKRHGPKTPLFHPDPTLPSPSFKRQTWTGSSLFSKRHQQRLFVSVHWHACASELLQQAVPHGEMVQPQKTNTRGFRNREKTISAVKVQQSNLHFIFSVFFTQHSCSVIYAFVYSLHLSH